MPDKPVSCPADLQARLDANPEHTHFMLTRKEALALLSCFPFRNPEPTSAGPCHGEDVRLVEEALSVLWVVGDFGSVSQKMGAKRDAAVVAIARLKEALKNA